MSVIADILKI